jgi:imidazolonepropionase-like amidohydrolase
MKFRFKIANIIFCFFNIFLFSSSAYCTTIYLQAKQYLDVESGKLIKPANIVIEDGVIQSLNPTQVPMNAKVIKRQDLTLLPGLMDMHVHLPLDFDNQFALRYVQEDAAIATTRGVKNAKLLLMSGFTTVRNLGQIYPGESFIDVGLSKASEAGWISAPHIIPAGHALSITGGHLDPDMLGSYAPTILSVSYRTGVADGIDEVVKATRYQIKHGAKVIKVAGTAGVLSQEEGVGDQQYSEAELKAIVEEANRHHIPVAVHAHGSAGIYAAIKAGVTSIEHGSILDDKSISLMKQQGIFLIPTASIKSADTSSLSPLLRKKHAYLAPLAIQSLEKAIRAGVNIAFGTDSGVIPHGSNAKEFAILVERGLSPLEAIRTATLNAAKLANLKDRGQLKVGYHADIIGVSDNPLTNIHILEKVNFVMKDGEVVKDVV